MKDQILVSKAEYARLKEKIQKQDTDFQNSLLHSLINSTGSIIVFSLDKNYCYTAFNEKHRNEMKQIWRVDIQLGMSLLDCMTTPELKVLAKKSIDRALNGESFLEIQHQPDVDIYYEFSWNPMYKHNEIVGVTAFVQDVTERKHAEDQIRKLNRIYAVLSNINQTIVRIHDTRKLLDEVCRIAVEYGKFRMVWIGLVNAATNIVDVAASSGFTGDYLEKLNIDLNDELLSSGPTGQAIKSGKYIVSNNIETDGNMIPWRENAIKYDYKSSASFPLFVFGKVFGALSIYAGEINFFEKEDIDLLVEMALDISFAFEFIETENNRKNAEATLLAKSEELERYFINSLDLLCIADTDGYFHRLNPEWESTLGFPLEELVGKRFLDFVHPNDLEATLQAMSNLKEQKEVLHFTNRYLCKDGSYKWVEWNSFPSGKLIYAVARDITERKLAEEERKKHIIFMENLDKINSAIHSANNLNEMMSNTLKAVISIFNSDRVWLFYPCDPGAPTFRVPMEITKPEYPGANILNIDIPLPPDMAQDLQKTLDSDEPVTFLEGTEKPINKVSAEKFAVKSMMMISLYPKLGEPWAFGMHQCSFPRVWTNDEIKLFKEISRRISDGLNSVLIFQDLKESEERFRRLAENARDIIYRMSLPDGKYEYVSPAATSILGYSPEEFYDDQELFKQIIHPDWNEYFEKNWDNLVQGILPPTYEYQVIHKSGNILWLNQRNILIKDDTGNPIAIEGIVTDITERKQSEIKILESEQLFRALVENSPDFIARYDRSYRRIYVNPAIQQLFGRTDKKVLGKTPADESPLSAPQIYIDHIQKVIETSRETIAEIPFRTSEGEIHWGQIRFVPEFDKEGKVSTVLTIGRDIHEIKENEKRFRMLAENFPDFVVRFDHENHYIYINPAVEKAFGISSEDFIGKTLMELPLLGKPEQNEKIMLLIRRAFNESVTNNSEVLWNTLLGERLFELRHVPEKDAMGNVVSVLGIARDITERKQAEEALHESDERFRTLIEQASDAFFIHNYEGKILDVNQRACDSLGYSRDELLSMNVADIDVEVIPYQHKQRFWETITPRKSATFEGKHCRKDGSIFPVEVNLGVLQLGEKKLMLALVRDITERKESEEELLRSEQRLRLHAEQSPLGFLEWDENFCAIEWNAACERIFGYSKEEAIGRHAKDLILPAEVHDLVDGIYRSLMTQAGGQHSINENITRDGRMITCEWFNTTLVNKEGKAIGVASICNDITERKQAAEALRESEEKYRTLIQKIQAAVVVHGADTSILTCNPRAHELLGLTEDQMLGKTAVDPDWHFFKEDGSVMPNKEYPVNRVMATNQPLRNYIVGVHRPSLNDDIWALVNADPVFDKENKIIQVIVSFIDISERKQAEKDLKEQMDEINRFNKLMVGREEKMIELKKEVNKMLEKQGQEKKYNVDIKE